MDYNVEYEMGELIEQAVNKPGVDREQLLKPVIKFGMKKGKTSCRILLPVLSTESAEQIKQRTDAAIAWAKRSLSDVVEPIHRP